MKIYFAGSISGGREKQGEYFDLINFLGEYGKVLTEHIGKEDTQIENEKQYSDKIEEHVYIRDIKWIDECDIIIAEASVTSLGVGYEIGYAESKGKEIVCLYDVNSVKKLSYMLSGNESNIIIKYSELSEVKDKLREYFESKA